MKTLRWQTTVKPFTLAANVSGSDQDDLAFDAIQKWCEENQFGTRISYNMFKFKNDQELGMFLLRWS